jgi:hypothetical protein
VEAIDAKRIRIRSAIGRTVVRTYTRHLLRASTQTSQVRGIATRIEVSMESSYLTRRVTLPLFGSITTSALPSEKNCATHKEKFGEAHSR